MPDNPLAAMNRLDPQLMAHLERSNELIYGSGAIPRKYKLLIAMAFDAAHGAEGGVRALANAAIREGASTQEITEVLRVAYYLSGVGTLYTASRALSEIAP